MNEDESLVSFLEEQGEGDAWSRVLDLLKEEAPIIEINKKMHATLTTLLGTEVAINAKYKTVDKKIRPAAVPLPLDAEDLMKRAKEEPRLRDVQGIGHKFSTETLAQIRIGGDGFLTAKEQMAFRAMITKHEKAFAFDFHEIGCVDPQVITPMIIFTIPHIPWDLKPIPVPKALVPQLIQLLKEKLESKILEQSKAPYSNRWFTVRKKNGKL